MNESALDDDQFERDQRLNTPFFWELQGYRWLGLAKSPDRDRMRAIEEAVAEGILRWLFRQKPGFNYDYWLIFFGVADDSGISTETWPILRRQLWIEMEAKKWLHYRDCRSPLDKLWVAAVAIVYARLFARREAL